MPRIIGQTRLNEGGPGEISPSPLYNSVSALSAASNIRPRVLIRDLSRSFTPSICFFGAKIGRFNGLATFAGPVSKWHRFAAAVKDKFKGEAATPPETSLTRLKTFRTSSRGTRLTPSRPVHHIISRPLQQLRDTH